MQSLTRAQSIEVDRLAMEDYGIPGIVLMENAARGVARAVLDRFGGLGPIAIACGPGNNGGDGLAAARHLKNGGAEVRIHLARPPERYAPESDAGINLAVASAMAIPIVENHDFGDAALILDAVFGTGLASEVSGPYRGMLEAILGSAAPVLAIDLPSGMDADTGAILGVAVRADVTATMVAPKAGFARAAGLVGEVVIVDIGAPAACLSRALRIDR